MPVSATDTVEREDLATTASRFRFGPEIKLDVLPGIAALRLQAERRGWLVAAMHHAIFAAMIAGHTVDDAVLVPLHVLEHLGVARVVRVGHQIAGAFPTADIPGRNRPGRA